ncbi:MAG: cytochrome b/b6 domain-containing protein [Ignavibacteriaceae bacterium]
MLVSKLWSSKKKLNQKNIIPHINKTENIVRIIVLFICLFILSTKNLIPQTNDECLTCHSDDTMTMERDGKELSIFVNDQILLKSAHKKLACVSCHTGFDPEEIPHKEVITPIDCKSCHKDAALKHTFHPQMMRAAGTNGRPEVSCKQCHGTHDVAPVNVKGAKWGKANLTEACSKCHKSVTDEYVHSSHSIAFKEGTEGAPNCLTCHKSNVTSISAGRDTLDLKLAQQQLCLSCHLDDPEIRSRTTPSAGFIKSYEESVHGIAFSRGNTDAATCINCHTSHDVKDKNNPASSVNRFKIPETCGQCHQEIAKEYEESIHGISAFKGNTGSPVCTDCHGEHNILRHDDPNSPVSFARVSKEICSPCHSSVKLSEKYGISVDRYKTFSDSYHGLALRGGSLEVANCASCHGVHNIKPSSDPTSTINKANLARTCGSCHPGANENFTVGKIHVTMEKDDEPILYWIASGYILLISLTIGGMFLHNFIDFIKKAKIKKLKQRGFLKEEHHGHALYLRMTLSERIQHASMAVSFIILVITGFMLRYPESWWVEHIRELSTDAFVYRSNLHRIAAVVMVAASLFHVYYVSFTSRGRQLIKDLFPVYKDITDAIGVAKFNLGFSKVKPKLDRFSYVEKAEYWALIWGTIVMTVTGIIMWFDNTFMGLLTKLGWDIARTIHFYEAWLAFLSIVVWHFYFVIFNPDIYPMSMAWLKGTISEEEMAEEHPLELERIKQKQEQDQDQDKESDQDQDTKENKEN